jgi:hypothetical protein
MHNNTFLFFKIGKKEKSFFIWSMACLCVREGHTELMLPSKYSSNNWDNCGIKFAQLNLKNQNCMILVILK